MSLAGALKRTGESMLESAFRAAGYPDFRNPEGKDRLVWQLVNNRLAVDRTANPHIVEIYQKISDEDIIYQKGEGAELVQKTPDGYQPRAGVIAMAKYFMAFRIFLVEKHVSPEATVLDVGASSGVFLKACGHKGFALNYSQEAVEKMTAANIESIRGSAEELPFGNGQFDYILCFQVIEHLENPVRALRELKRVSRAEIFITLPGVRATRVCGFSSNERGVHRWHLFEFSHKDFTALAKHLNMEIIEFIPVRPLGLPLNAWQRYACRMLRDHPWFVGFFFFRIRSENQR